MTWYTMRCPTCGVELRSPDVRTGQVLACPNVRGGCGQPSQVYRGLKVPKAFHIGKVT